MTIDRLLYYVCFRVFIDWFKNSYETTQSWLLHYVFGAGIPMGCINIHIVLCIYKYIYNASYVPLTVVKLRMDLYT